MVEAAAPVVWITGLAGAGKTTLADLVFEAVKREHPNCVRVDGDAMREICGNDLGYSVNDRIKNAYRLSRFCKFLNDQGLLVICSTMSLYPEIWDWNRRNFKGYLEVFLRVGLDELHARDKKGLYSTSAQDELSDVVGRGQEFIEPTSPDLVLNNDHAKDLLTNVKRILHAIGVQHG